MSNIYTGAVVHARSGTLTSNIENYYLRFCPVCVDEDINLYGETYWHRTHQLPGIFVCPQHLVFLENGKRIEHYNRKNSLITAKKIVQNTTPIFLDLSNKNHSIHIVLAQQAFFLLHQKGLDYCGPDFFRKRFQKTLFNKGLASINGGVYITKICELFKQSYEQEILSQLGCELQDNYSWIKRLLQQSQFFQHPVRNFLFLHFLEYSIEDFLQVDEKIYPFGKPSYPCFNSHSDHNLKLTVNQCKVSRKGNLIIGTFFVIVVLSIGVPAWMNIKIRFMTMIKLFPVVSFTRDYVNLMEKK